MFWGLPKKVLASDVVTLGAAALQNRAKAKKLLILCYQAKRGAASKTAGARDFTMNSEFLFRALNVAEHTKIATKV